MIPFFTAVGVTTSVITLIFFGMLLNAGVRSGIADMWRARRAANWANLQIPKEGVVEILFQLRLGQKMMADEFGNMGMRSIWITKDYKSQQDIRRFFHDPQPIGIFLKKLANDWPTLSAQADEYRGPRDQ